MKTNTKRRLFEVIRKIDDTYKSDILNEAKEFAQLRKLNKKLYDDTIDLEGKIGDDVLKLIDNAIKNLKYDTNEEKELAYLIILDLILSRFLDRKT